MSLRLCHALAAAAAVCAAPAAAEPLSAHTFLVAWAFENCEGFDYPQDLSRHAAMAVFSAEPSEVADLSEKAREALDLHYGADLGKYCDFLSGFLREEAAQ